MYNWEGYLGFYLTQNSTLLEQTHYKSNFNKTNYSITHRPQGGMYKVAEAMLNLKTTKFTRTLLNFY